MRMLRGQRPAQMFGENATKRELAEPPSSSGKPAIRRQCRRVVMCRRGKGVPVQANTYAMRRASMIHVGTERGAPQVVAAHKG